MEHAGIVQLPAKKIQQKTPQKPLLWTEKTQEQPRIAYALGGLIPIRVQPVTEKAQIDLWNEFLDRYHYLGCTWGMRVHRHSVATGRAVRAGVRPKRYHSRIRSAGKAFLGRLGRGRPYSLISIAFLQDPSANR